MADVHLYSNRQYEDHLKMKHVVYFIKDLRIRPSKNRAEKVTLLFI